MKALYVRFTDKDGQFVCSVPAIGGKVDTSDRAHGMRYDPYHYGDKGHIFSVSLEYKEIEDED